MCLSRCCGRLKRTLNGTLPFCHIKHKCNYCKEGTHSKRMTLWIHFQTFFESLIARVRCLRYGGVCSILMMQVV